MFFGFNKLLASVAVLASVMIFQSCLDDDDNDYYRYAFAQCTGYCETGGRQFNFLCSWMTVRHCYLSI